MRFISLIRDDHTIVSQRPLNVPQEQVDEVLEAVAHCLKEAGLNYEVAVTEVP